MGGVLFNSNWVLTISAFQAACVYMGSEAVVLGVLLMLKRRSSKGRPNFVSALQRHVIG